MKIAVNTVTFRDYSIAEVVSILSSTKVQAVEWAGDTHLPPGDFKSAALAKSLCEEAGIVCTSYGSYYQCDDQGQGAGPFRFNLGAAVALDTAAALGVDAIRVWAGRMGSASASVAYREEVARCLAGLCDQADARGMTIHLEFHQNTLTDSAESCGALIEAVSKDNLYCYWQPRHGVDLAGNVADIEALGKRISNVHVYHWVRQADGVSNDRRPLKEGRERWEAYFAALDALPRDRYAMIEFVKDDTRDQFFEDLAVLRLINGGAELAIDSAR